jgi:hypothetical protein
LGQRQVQSPRDAGNASTFSHKSHADIFVALSNSWFAKHAMQKSNAKDATKLAPKDA